jgi:hypothetical protein
VIDAVNETSSTTLVCNRTSAPTRVQGYFAHKKTPTPYERGTPVVRRIWLVRRTYRMILTEYPVSRWAVNETSSTTLVCNRMSAPEPETAY